MRNEASGPCLIQTREHKALPCPCSLGVPAEGFLAPPIRTVPFHAILKHLLEQGPSYIVDQCHARLPVLTPSLSLPLINPSPTKN